MHEFTNGILTERGNLRSDVQKNIKKQAIAKLNEMGFETKDNGRLSMVVGTVGDNVISINLDVSVGLNTKFSKKDGRKEPTEAEVAIPQLF